MSWRIFFKSFLKVQISTEILKITRMYKTRLTVVHSEPFFVAQCFIVSNSSLYPTLSVIHCRLIIYSKIFTKVYGYDFSNIVYRSQDITKVLQENRNTNKSKG